METSQDIVSCEWSWCYRVWQEQSQGPWLGGKGSTSMLLCLARQPVTAPGQGKVLLAWLFSILLALCSIIFIMLLPSESYVTGSRVVKEFTMSWWRNSPWRSVGLRSDYEGHWSKRSNQRIQDLIHWYSLQSHMKSHENCFVSQLLNISSLEDETKSPSILICNEKKSQIFYMLWQYKLDNWQKFQSNLRRKQIFVIFYDCKDMLQNVDEIISQPFPFNRVFNGKLTNFEVGFILQPYF